MSVQHRDLADGRWHALPLVEQLANTGSEVERFLKWKEKDNSVYSDKAFFRALELLDLTLGDPKNRSRLRELARVRESLVDYFYGAEEYASTASSWRLYFSKFTYAVRKNK